MCKKNRKNSVCQTKYVKQFITSPGLVRYLIILIFLYQMNRNRNNGTMVIIITWSIVDCRLEPLSGQTKDYKTDIFCFFAKHAVLRSKRNTAWLEIKNQVVWNIYLWRYQIKHVRLLQSRHCHHLIVMQLIPAII